MEPTKKKGLGRKDSINKKGSDIKDSAQKQGSSAKASAKKQGSTSKVNTKKSHAVLQESAEKTVVSTPTKYGRKPKGDKKRTREITLRLSPDEYQQLELLAQKHHIDLDKRGQLGPFLRRTLLSSIPNIDKKIPNTSDNNAYRMPKSVETLSYEINRIGINVNQVCKRINTKERQYSEPKLVKDVEILGQNIALIAKKMNQFFKR